MSDATTRAAGPSTARGIATRARIIEAATTEFAQYGLAGARIDRIVAAARTNKAQLYAYFKDKDGLFDAIFVDSLERITEMVPIRDGDLADWAVRLYDDYLANPELIRLATWVRLERRPAGTLAEEAEPLEDVKVRAIKEAQAAGRVRAADAYDLKALVIGMSMTWSPVSNVYAATADEPDEVHERRRTLLRESVARVAAPG
ncbi:TetR family transcriptional regulator [Nocardioides panzhihuensis]|uniref:AcrR family transcriptional regulator n=1 Tax=Nocardioides panzhihuensis TaxID=860243 RepID=A0A7Z0ISD7_9ACTN|nr:TetR family transcriptional regulator [Nocardioides panzhihuensis]NYI77841.1 AcrR family transcriptional regulator [Nocardioides panzhihuensis]